MWKCYACSYHKVRYYMCEELGDIIVISYCMLVGRQGRSGGVAMETGGRKMA